jgi:hypothetical protein
VITDPARPPVRLQRHVPNSIATVHCMLVAAIAVCRMSRIFLWMTQECLHLLQGMPIVQS